MKNIYKVLSVILLVFLMVVGLSDRVNVKSVNKLELRDVLTEDMSKDKTGKIARKAQNEEPQNKISAVKAQVSEEVEGKRHIRFVVGIDSVQYAEAKFNIIAKDGDEVVKIFADQKVTYAYTYIEVSGETLAANAIFGADYNYLIAFTIKNIPQAAWDYNFEVTSSIRTEEAEWTNSEVATKVISEIVEADQEIEVPTYMVTTGTINHTSAKFTIKWKNENYKIIKAPVQGDFKVNVTSIAGVNNVLLSDTELTFTVVTGYSANRTITAKLIISDTLGYEFKFYIVENELDHYTFEEYEYETQKEGPAVSEDVIVIAGWGRFIDEARFNLLVEDFEKYLIQNEIPYTEVIGNYYNSSSYNSIANYTSKILEDGGADIILPCATNFNTNQSNFAVIDKFTPINVYGQSGRQVAMTSEYALTAAFIEYVATESAIHILSSENPFQPEEPITKTTIVIAGWGRFIEEERFNLLVEDFEDYLKENAIEYTEVVGNYYDSGAYYNKAPFASKIASDGGADIVLPCATNFNDGQSSVPVLNKWTSIDVHGQSNRVVAMTSEYSLTTAFIDYLATESAVAILTNPNL